MPSKSTAPYLYRILSFRHVVDMFEKRELHFSSPSRWDDPYEWIWEHKRSGATYAQCWCRRAVSDAMWRIYSTDRMSVRIRTTRAKLKSALERATSGGQFMYFIQDVDYRSPSKVRLHIGKIAHQANLNFDLSIAVGALFVKRDAFDHEAEVRVVVHDPSRPDFDHSVSSIRVPADPHDFVESIMFDPRADDAFMRMCEYYLQHKLGYRGSVGKSALYRLSELHLT